MKGYNMSYSTDFVGSFKSVVAIPSELVEIINKFSTLNHTGIDNRPGKWCDFECNDHELFWNNSEKTMNGAEWLQYILKHFIVPYDIKLNGVMYWSDDFGGHGKITMKDSVLKAIEF